MKSRLGCSIMSRQMHRAFLLPSRKFISPRFERVARRYIAGSVEMTSRHEAARSAETEYRDLQQSSTGSILRGWLVYTALGFPSFVDASPTLLKITTSIPLIKQVALSLIRNTFFSHFVGGESFQQTVPLIHSLRSRNLASMLVYSVEVDEAEEKKNANDGAARGTVPQYEKNIQEILSSIPLAGEVEEARNSGKAISRSTWIAIKLTALVPSATSLKNFTTALINHRTEPNAPFGTELLYTASPPVPMTESDVDNLRALHSTLIKIAELALKHQVRIFFDAEYTWYQPAIDAFATDLMQRSNTLLHASPANPVVYLTFQAYLRSTPARLRNAYVHAASNGYILGAKLVRGAYHPQEIEYHTQHSANEDSPPPVWSEKHETDQCFNECVGLLLDNVSRPTPRSEAPSSAGSGISFGTHNKQSCDLILDGLVKRGLATLDQSSGTLKIPEATAAQVQLGQLFGMADELTNYLSCRLDSPDVPMVFKYIPYGRLEDVMPYLGRRAIENKSVLDNSNTAMEQQRLSKELKRRIFHST